MNNLKLVSRKIMYFALGWCDSLLGQRSDVVVLCYHSISSDGWRYSVNAKEFEWQLNYMVSRYRPIRLGELTEILSHGTSPAEPVFALTFDDGYADVLAVRKICKKLEISPTIFVMGLPKRVDRQVLQTKRRLLARNELRGLVADGWEIGSHGGTHRILTDLLDKELKDEIAVSRSELSRAVGNNVVGFSYPKGRYNDSVVLEVKRSGYRWAVSMDDKACVPGCDLYTIPRVGVDGSHGRQEFGFLMSPTVLLARRVIKSVWPNFEI